MIYWKVVEHKYIANSASFTTITHRFLCIYKAQKFYDGWNMTYKHTCYHYIDRPEQVEDDLVDLSFNVYYNINIKINK